MATCRCGVALAAEDVAAVQVQEAGAPRGGPPVFVTIALIAVLAGAGYWMFMRQSAVSIEAENGLSEALESPAAGTSAAVSPEARTWDAAARARANVLPGTLRDELRNNRLDFEW